MPRVEGVRDRYTATLKERAEGRRNKDAANGRRGRRPRRRRSVAHVRIAAVDGRVALPIVALCESNAPPVKTWRERIARIAV